MTYSKFRTETVGDGILTVKQVNSMCIRTLTAVAGLSVLSEAVCNFLHIKFPIAEIFILGLVALYIGVFDLVSGDKRMTELMYKISRFGVVAGILCLLVSVFVILLSL